MRVFAPTLYSECFDPAAGIAMCSDVDASAESLPLKLLPVPTLRLELLLAPALPLTVPTLPKKKLCALTLPLKLLLAPTLPLTLLLRDGHWRCCSDTAAANALKVIITSFHIACALRVQAQRPALPAHPDPTTPTQVSVQIDDLLVPHPSQAGGPADGRERYRDRLSRPGGCGAGAVRRSPRSGLGPQVRGPSARMVSEVAGYGPEPRGVSGRVER
jgi:hypothetical protein